MPLIGFLSSLGRNDRPALTEAFHRGLSEAGYAEGRNLLIEYRFAENQYDRLPALAAELVRRNVAVLAATGGGNTISAAKAATASIPVVFTFGGDPVHEGFVASLNRPGGNVTGASFFSSPVLSAKQLALLAEIAPNAQLVGVLVNQRNPEAALARGGVEAAARTLGRRLLMLDVSAPEDIDAAFATMRQQGARALLVAGDAFLTVRRQQVISLAARDAIPAIYATREHAPDGGIDETHRCLGCLSSRGPCDGANSERRETRRYSRGPGDAFPFCHQSQDGASAGHRDSDETSCHRR
jgi:putative ABC transport system substrate-binding protein